jgi:protein-tyrosine phosphatase
MTIDAERRLDLPDCFNVRDVGGYATEDGASIRWRTLLRADNLCRLTPESADALVEYGVRTIVDLRHPRELPAAAHPFAPGGSHADTATYWHWPLRDPADEALDRAVQEATSLLQIAQLSLDHSAPRLAAIARSFAGAPDGGVLVHCHVGKDRTGTVIAVLLALAGVPHETIVADYALSEGYLRPLYEARRAAGQAADYDAWRSDPETMRAFLTHLDGVHGGARAYLRARGLTEQEIAQVRHRLRE